MGGGTNMISRGAASLSSLPPCMAPLPLALPMASISSINTMHGAFSLACLNKSHTLEAPTPTNISTKSDPEIEKNGTSASPAITPAVRLLPPKKYPSELVSSVFLVAK